jgi:hypothetical protein
MKLKIEENQLGVYSEKEAAKRLTSRVRMLSEDIKGYGGEEVSNGMELGVRAVAALAPIPRDKIVFGYVNKRLHYDPLMSKKGDEFKRVEEGCTMGSGGNSSSDDKDVVKILDVS